METEIDWNYLSSIRDNPTYDRRNEISKILKSLPREKWNSKSDYQMTLLHYATLFSDIGAVVLLLQIMGLDYIDALDSGSRSATWIAAGRGKADVLQLLIAGGANYFTKRGTWSPLETAIRHGNHLSCIRLLSSNGVRLNNQTKHLCKSLITFDRGVVRCRDVIVTLLGLKKRRHMLVKLDRFLIKQELAVAIWTTRTQTKWQ